MTVQQWYRLFIVHNTVPSLPLMIDKGSLAVPCIYVNVNDLQVDNFATIAYDGTIQWTKRWNVSAYRRSDFEKWRHAAS